MGYLDSGSGNVTEAFLWDWRSLGAVSDVCWINTHSGVIQDWLAFKVMLQRTAFLVSLNANFHVYKLRVRLPSHLVFGDLILDEGIHI